LVSALFGLFLAFLCHANSMHLMGAGVDVTLCAILVLLLQAPALNESFQLDREDRALRDQRRQLKAVGDQMTSWANRHERINRLWLYQTMNQLDLCEEWSSLIQKIIHDVHHSEVTITQIDAVRNTFFKTIDDMGPMSLYVGEDALGEDFLAHAGEQMKNAYTRIGGAVDELDLIEVERLLSRCFCFLFVQVVDLSDMPHAGARVVATTHAAMPRNGGKHYSQQGHGQAGGLSSTDQGVSLPFGERAYMCVPMDDEVLELTVLDSTGWVGSACLRFRHEAGAGEWNGKNLNLYSVESRIMPMKLTFKLFYGTSIRHYAEAIGSRPT